MDRIPSPRELTTAARACVIMAYTGGLAGVAAGTLLLRDGELAFAVIVWTLTFAVGATLMAVSVLIRAFAGVQARLERLDDEVRTLTRDRGGPRGAGTDTGWDPSAWPRH